MPKWLVLAAVAAVIILIAGMSWYNRRALEQPADAPVATAASPQADPASGQPAEAPAPQAAAQGPVTISASEPAWLQVKEQGKTLFEGMLSPGQTFPVPPTATAPLLKAGKPEALRITVGNSVAPPVGPPGHVASNVSLLAADLMRGPQAGSVPGAATPPAQQR
jgi:hypothetical protein